MLIIRGERLMADLRRLRDFGRRDSGVVRPALSEVDVQSRHWLVSRMMDAGLDASLDGIGNVFGRSRGAQRTLLIGSHTDTQPEGGWLDGAMGVIYALEIARALQERPIRPQVGVDIVSWVDEEARFAHFLGSRSFVGELSAQSMTKIAGTDGVLLTQALSDASIAHLPRSRLDRCRHLAYLEAHIEQGGCLETQGKRIGIVTGIVGIRSFQLSFRGQQNHAGTTPMSLRRDAGRALIRLAAELDEVLAATAGPPSVWTMGKIHVHPGSESVIAGVAELVLQFRDTDAATLQRMEDALMRQVADFAQRSPVDVRIEPTSKHAAPALMDVTLQECLVRAAEHSEPGCWMKMQSGAGHDAQVLSRHIPSAMMFVPSIGGISHSFAEDTSEDDIVFGCQVFATAVASVLERLASEVGVT